MTDDSEHSSSSAGQRLGGYPREIYTRLTENCLWRDLCEAAGTHRLGEERRRHHRQLHTATTQLDVLQHALLPGDFPEVEGVSLAVRYLSATDIDIGGDWYDAFTVDAVLTVTIGDVAGHGFDAISTMGELRSAARAVALIDNDPSFIAAALSRYVNKLSSAELATAVIATYNPASRVFSWANAGHIPPLHIPSSGLPRYLDHTIHPPLGTPAADPPPTATITLRPGDAIVLFTDGLVERRGEHLDHGLQRVADALIGGQSAEKLCIAALDCCLPFGNPSDDACVIAFTS